MRHILTAELLGLFLEDCGFHPADSQPGQKTAIFFQGAVPVDNVDNAEATLQTAGNTPNLYNDSPVLFGLGLDGGDYCRAWKGTVDPGTYYRPAQGTMHQVFFAPLPFVKGSRNDRPEDVFRPFKEKNRIWRDKDFDHQHDPDEGVTVELYRGGLIHVMAGAFINKYAAGCLGIWDADLADGEDWGEFKRAGYVACEANAAIYGEEILPVYIIRWLDFCRWQEVGRDRWAPTLFPGAMGPWAKAVQALLNDCGGTPIAEDGDWMDRTTDKVKALQAASGLEVDGIVGPATWENIRGQLGISREDVVELVRSYDVDFEEPEAPAPEVDPDIDSDDDDDQHDDPDTGLPTVSFTDASGAPSPPVPRLPDNPIPEPAPADDTDTDTDDTIDEAGQARAAAIVDGTTRIARRKITGEADVGVLLEARTLEQAKGARARSTILVALQRRLTALGYPLN